ncbi:flagellar hook-associated protein 3 [Caldalkalibacillus thermarum TA2.A1]|uniref:Flagellar hook-associated protein 3 n=1 Tax=Caldalkalibacillus thermarum (strain TA2.A1) TaxID=986075 RepID=F5L4E6_CALTT|nr:flagellar hook-associated protein FlgL [Caldalkalibacillus thermarum]EGL83789.1 flagellar hook-associated protein 3 [Caldalkalibacillus thermarum TA2.A1]QZT33965.1 flagellar hook-associated protein FlgL [Caldalkalibacillus thermarum TA2.A1]
MRVTPKMISDQMLNNLNRNLSRLEKVQWQLSTGRKISKPSDDPVGLNYALRYRSELAANQQYQRNLDSALSWLENADIMVGQVVNVIQRARELTVQGSTGSNSAQSLQAIAAEIDQLIEQLREIANSRFNGKYIFNGQRTDQPPYPDDDFAAAQFDTGKIEFEVGRGVTIAVNQHAGEIFGEGTETDNLFIVLGQIRDALRDNDPEAAEALLGQLDSRMDKVLEKWADIGARYNRLELMDNRLKDNTLNFTNLLSKTEDADLAEVIINLRTEENIYRSSLAAGARIIQPSLIDFLR